MAQKFFEFGSIHQKYLPNHKPEHYPLKKEDAHGYDLQGRKWLPKSRVGGQLPPPLHLRP